MKNTKINFKIKKGEKKTVLIERSGEYIIELVGEGAEVNIVGAFVGLKNEEFNVRTIQRHKAPNTKSDLLIKSVLFENSKFIYNGQIFIEKEAKGADAYQRNDNLLFGKNVKVETRPFLEIKTNNIKCAHGVSTGKVSEEQMFYLLSRGLSKKEAEKIIIEGFFNILFSKLKNEKDQERLIKHMQNKLY